MKDGFMIVYWVCCGVITALNTFWIVMNMVEIKRLDNEKKRLRDLLGCR